MKRKHKKYSKPRKAYERARILDENKLVEKYGLKNKHEIWKADAKVSYFRARAKALITAASEEQVIFINKLKKLGFNVSSIADILALSKEDILRRRLSTIIFKKGLAKTQKQARQLIVHKKILVDGKVLNVPSYIVSVEEENSITIKIKRRQARLENKTGNKKELPVQQQATVQTAVQETAQQLEQEVKN